MSIMKSIVLAIGIFGIGIFAVACGDDDEGSGAPAVASVAASAVGSAMESSSGASGTSGTAAASQTAASSASGAAGTAPVSKISTASASGSSVPIQAPTPQYATGSTEAGIWVTGTGSINLAPDITFVRLGVEATSPSVTDARDEAATAMEAVVTAVKENGLTDEDIQTTSFNIWPQYQYQEVVNNGVRSNVRVLSGYTVSNDVVIKVRDLDSVGTIIDDVVDAGGDAARINGIDFSIEDPGAYTAGLREEAVSAAIENAEHFATLTDVTLGRLIYVTEVGNEPVVQGIAESRAFALPAAAAPPTGISGGSLDLTLTVRAGFAIW